MAKNDFYNAEIPVNYERKAPVVLVIDDSGSMTGKPAEELTKGLQVFKQQIQDDLTASSRLEISIVKYNSDVVVTQDFTTIHEMQIPHLETIGTTKMVDGIRKAINMIHERVLWHKNSGLSNYTPIIIHITDGYPDSDQDIEGLKKEITEGVENKQFRFWSFSVQDADMELLRNISHNDFPPLKLEGVEFVKFFRWLSDSITAITNSRPDEKIDITPKENENPFLLTV